MTLGQSVRTPRRGLPLGAQRRHIFTSLVDRDFSPAVRPLFDGSARFRGGEAALAAADRRIDKARDDERAQFGETVYLLEPNVKRSRAACATSNCCAGSALRARQADPEALRLMGAFARRPSLRSAGRRVSAAAAQRDALSRRQSARVLDRAEQLRVAEVLASAATASMLPVEQFMREYFRHTNHVWHIVARFRRRPPAHGRGWRIRSRPCSATRSRATIASGRGGSAPPHGLAKLRATGKCCGWPIWRTRRTSGSRTTTWKADPASRPANCPPSYRLRPPSGFCRCFAAGQLGTLLRKLHELGVLEKIIPDLKHARCLLQFNEYHKYTVDEHCCGGRARDGVCRGDGALGEVYRGIKRQARCCTWRC